MIKITFPDGAVREFESGVTTFEIAQSISNSLAKKALAGKLKPDEMADSTFTISNLGMYGVKSFVPIINQPNTAILGVSATVPKPVVFNGEVTVRPIMTLTLTADHRVVDGLEGAKFMKTLKEAIENPLSLLI